MNRKNAISYLLITLIWVVIACLHLFSGYLDAIKYRGSYVFNGSEVLYYLLSYQSWAILSIGFFVVVKIYSQRFSAVTLTIFWLILALLWIPLFLGWDTWLRISLLSSVQQNWLTVFSQTSNATVFFYFVFYCVTTAVSAAIFYYRSSQKALINALTLEKKHADSVLKITEIQLEQLQSQLSPHFLFNCLSSVSALARTDNKEALISAVAQMGNLLRFCVSSSSERFIPLAKELEFVDDYIKLQTLRYPNLFKFEQSIAGELSRILCPPFFLQPLIENAFTHGVDLTQEVTDISLKLEVSKQHLVATLTNTKSQMVEKSIGLNSAIKNFKDRLNILYPEQYQLDIENSARNYTITVCIPTLTQESIDGD